MIGQIPKNVTVINSNMGDNYAIIQLNDMKEEQGKIFHDRPSIFIDLIIHGVRTSNVTT